MSASMSSEARRFTWLIDVFYDHKVKLIMSAEVAPEELYTEGRDVERVPSHGVAYH
jgi:cell division protein ZapE